MDCYIRQLKQCVEALMSSQPTEDLPDTDNLDFKPSRVIVMSELSSSEREPYYNLILSNNVKLQYSDNQFVANVRLLGPTGDAYEESGEENKDVKLNGHQTVSTTPGRKSNSGLPLEKRMHRLQVGTITKQLSFQITGVTMFDYSIFSRFCSLIGNFKYCGMAIQK